MNAEPRAALLSHPRRPVRIAQIQQQLDRLWDSDARELRDGEVVTRACMSNLIVYCDDDAQRLAIEPVIPAIAQTHPVRVILLVGNGATDDPGIEVFVSGHSCALTGGWQVCAEQICVVADADSQRRLPSVTRAQLVGDLPTALWWVSAQPPPFAGKLFHKLAGMADQILYDSIGWNQPTQGMQAMSRWVAGQRGESVIYNLAWRRLKPWRSLLAQVLDPAVQPGALPGVQDVHIEHGPHAQAMALLLLGWLASRLNWQVADGAVTPGKQTAWRFRTQGRTFSVTVVRAPGGEPAPQHLRWCWRDSAGTQRRALFALLDGQRLGVVEEGSDVPACVISAPDPLLSDLVAAQLAHRTRDKLFEDALAAGERMTAVLAR